VTTPESGTTTLAYNSQGLPVSVVYPDGTSLKYTYNACGQRSSLTSNTGYNCSYAYDNFCRLSKVFDGNGSVLASYEYGQHSVKKQLGNGMYTEYAYEKGSYRLQHLRNFFPNGTLMSYYSYVYDEWGYRIEAETHEGIWKYRYDAAGQLIEWRSPFSDVYEIIEYSSNLNRKSKQSVGDKSFYTTNFLHQYTKYGNYENFTYDVNGNLHSKSKSNGTRLYIEQFVYDQLGHCTSITVEQLTCQYHHNVFGAVSSKNCSNGYYMKYLVDPFGTYGTNVISEQTAFGQKMIYYGHEHGLIAMIDSADPHDAIFYVFDGDGSTINTASQMGEILMSYIYDPFGLVLSNVVDDVNMFQFLGQYGIQIVSETANIVLVRNRLYDSKHARFISPDPTGVFGSPTNPYSYANNNPLTFKDTNGLFVFLPVVVAVGKVVLVRVAKGAATAGIQAAFLHLYKLRISGDKFEWRKFAKETLTSAARGAITSANPFKSPESKFLFSFSATLLTGGNLLDALESGAVNFIPEELQLLYSLYRANFDVVASKYYQKSGFTDLLIDTFMRWVRSIDPNEITGPVGYGDANYISADQSLLYKIEFENNPNATAPAQKVIIRCPIDSNLELGTFKVGLITFDIYEKDFGFRSPGVQNSYIDAREKTGTFVQVQVFIDALNKEGVWLLQSIDPLTGLPPTNPLVGFLPPNNGTNGQGFVTFSIDLKRSVQSLTKITENATIVFDENPHLDTSTIFHTVDKTAGTVSINASTQFGGVLFNLVTEDVGSGVKSVDLYVVRDGSAELIKSEINQSVIILQLTENVVHTIVGVATDYVGNSGTLGIWGSVDVYIPTDCPANCSGRGQCGSGGVCICDSGYGGYNCSLNVTESCEPPILEVSHSDSVNNDSLVVFISARSSQPESATSLSVKIVCKPNDTVISNGRQESDGTYLDKDDFGNVQFTTPSWFHGLLVCKIQATVVDDCGTNVRAVLLTAHIAATGQTTVRTDTGSATAATTSVMIPVTSLTGSVTQSPGVSGWTGSITSTPSYVSQPDGRTSDQFLLTTDMSVSQVAITQLSTMTPVTQTSFTDSIAQSPSVGGRTVTGTATQAYVSQNDGRTDQKLSTYDATVTQVVVTQTSGASKGTTVAMIWDAWSNWTPCTRSCDTGIQERTRHCLLPLPADCGPDSTDQRFCQLSACPGTSIDVLGWAKNWTVLRVDNCATVNGIEACNIPILSRGGIKVACQCI